jgi:hypothetical protein
LTVKISKIPDFYSAASIIFDTTNDATESTINILKRNLLSLTRCEFMNKVATNAG